MARLPSNVHWGELGAAEVTAVLLRKGGRLFAARRNCCAVANLRLFGE
jgi:hypothetical protein